MKEEISHVINTLKFDKAPGPDGISNEMLKLGERALTPWLTQLMNNILMNEQVPKEWLESEIILIHKKGYKNKISNYRPISLMSCLYKILSTLLCKRMKRKLNEQQPSNQAGFRAGYSTIDHLHTVNTIIETALEYNYPICLALIDYEKAFDSYQSRIYVQGAN